MRFALVSQDKAHGARFRINPFEGDATGFMNWVDVWQGYHFSFANLREDMSILRHFDVVMFSGNPHNFRDIVNIAEFLKPTKTVTMFYPEGSAQLYDNSINGFEMEIYDAWNACDVLSIAEEDKKAYYEAFVDSGKTIVRFIHVPMRREMDGMGFFAQRVEKERQCALVYGDNNPNHPLIAIAAAARCGLSVMAVDCNRGKANKIQQLFRSTEFFHVGKLGQFHFLNLMRTCYVSFYPTEWIGTARHQISCAVTGTPCIGNHDSHTQRRLFPDLGCDIYDIDRMADLFEILKNDGVYEGIASRARKAVEFYSLDNTCKRFLAAVGDAERMKEKNRIHAVGVEA